MPYYGKYYMKHQGRAERLAAQLGMEDPQVLEPGFAGTLHDHENTNIRIALSMSPRMRVWWGFPRHDDADASTAMFGQQAYDAVKQVAMYGDPENVMHNAKLVRQSFAAMAKAS